jgi:hypothetical protein
MMDYEQRILEMAKQDMVTGEDGYVVYWPSENRGSWSAHHLRIIADELDRRNAKWDAELTAAMAAYAEQEKKDG